VLIPRIVPLRFIIYNVACEFFFAIYQLNGKRSWLNHWIYGQVAAVTGAPLVYASSQFQDHTDIGYDDCPPTPGDDDDDEDDKDKVGIKYRILSF